MKKLILPLIILLFAFFLKGYSQNTSQPIEVIKKTGLFKKTIFKKCDVELMPQQLLTLAKDDPNLKQFVVPMAVRLLSYQILYLAGTVLISIPLFDNEDPNWTLAYIGAGCVLLSIPIKNSFYKKTEEAVNYYNAGYRKTGFNLNFQVGQDGIGLAMRF